MRCVACSVVCLVVIVTCGAAPEQASCLSVHNFFQLANLSVDEPPHDALPPAGLVCEGACCSWRREAALRARVRRDFSALAAHTSRALHGLLTQTHHTLHDHVMELSKQSLNKTKMFFAQVYKNMSVHAQKPIDELYTVIRSYVNRNNSQLQLGGVDLERSTTRFFRDIFPLVYHKAAKQQWQGRDFTPDYKGCLREAYAEMAPFGDIPRQIATSLAKNLEATRTLLESLEVAADVLQASDAILAEEWGGGTGSGGACHAALLKMSYCGKCRGLPLRVKPCENYCLNVLRGCVTWRVAELDAPWNSFVEDVQRLMTAEQGSDGRVATGDAALRPLDSRISEAVVHAMENGIHLEKKVKHACGHARLVDAAPTTPVVASLVRREQLRVAPPDTHITHFLASVDKSRGFYQKLSDTLCRDESFTEQAGEPCWDGERVGQYTKNLVLPGASSQKYNPEVALPSAVDDPRVALLADKLLHVTQMLVSQLPHSGGPESFSYMQGDEAGAGGEGSGSGRDDYNDDNYDGEGSGEGSGSIEATDTPVVLAPKQSGAVAGRISHLLVALLLLVHPLRRHLPL